jgi:hypothetical protein
MRSAEAGLTLNRTLQFIPLTLTKSHLFLSSSKVACAKSCVRGTRSRHDVQGKLFPVMVLETVEITFWTKFFIQQSGHVAQLVNKFPAFNGTQSFVTAFARTSQQLSASL